MKGYDRSLADPWTRARAARGDGGDRLSLRRQLVAVDRREDPAAHRAARARAAGSVERPTRRRLRLFQNFHAEGPSWARR